MSDTPETDRDVLFETFEEPVEPRARIARAVERESDRDRFADDPPPLDEADEAAVVAVVAVVAEDEVVALRGPRPGRTSGRPGSPA